MTRETWEGDTLDRKASADFLTQYLTSRYEAEKGNSEGSFVLAINADWGYGKTFLLKNWEQDVREMGHPTVYFDAWQNDYTSEPLIGFIAELNASLEDQFKRFSSTQRLTKGFLDSAKQVIKTTLITGAGIAAKRLIGVSVEEALEAYRGHEEDNEQNSEPGSADKDISTLISKAVDAALKDHKNAKHAIETFKSNLSALISHLEDQDGVSLPIFIFIDELDRCRPSYAVELLENIKHLFGVKGVHFIIATNVRQLAHSVGVLYGASFDSEKYLKRFFDQEYNLPRPDNHKFAEHLFATIDPGTAQKLFTGLGYTNYSQDPSPSRLFSTFTMAFRLDLRSQQQIAGYVKAILLTISRPVIHAPYLFFLLMLKHVSSSAYERVLDMVEHPDQKGFHEAVAKHLDPAINIEFYSGDTFSNETISIQVQTIAWAYVSSARLALRDIDDNTAGGFPGVLLAKVKGEQGASISGSQKHSSLRQYPEIISQVGHLVTL